MMRVNSTTLKRVLVALWPSLFLAAITFAVFFTTLVIKDRTFYAFPDNIDQFFAWYQKLAHAVHHGTLPIWDANVSSGHSFVGELQEGVFYPVNLVWVWLFGSARGISTFWLELIVIFHFWLASVGMYLAARSLGLKKAGALVAGMAFAFGGGVAVRSISQTAIFFGLCYIPWVFYWFQRWMQSKRAWNLLLASVSLALIILAGHVDPWYFACLITALSVIFTRPHPSFEPWGRVVVKRLGALIAVIAASLVIAFPQVVLSAQYLPHAVRFVGDSQPIGPSQKVSTGTYISHFNFNPQDFLSLVDPVKYTVADGNEIYIGLVGLATVLAVALIFRKSLRQHPAWRSHGTFLLGASAVATVIMLGYWTFIPAVLRQVPFFSQVRQLARYSIILQFCLSIAVGICVEVLATNFVQVVRNRKQQLLVLGVATMALGFLALNSLYYYLLSRRSSVVDKHLVYQSIVLTLALAGCLLFRKKLQYILVGAFVLSSITQTVWFMPRISSFESTYPPNYYRLTPAITYLEQYYGKDRVDILDNALPTNIGDVYNIQTIGGYGATLHQPYYLFLNEPDASGQVGQHLDLLNVRFVVSKQPQPGLQLVFTDQIRHIYVYQRSQYLPRAYFAQQAAVCDEHAVGCTPITISRYTDSDIVVHYQSDAAETLVLSEVNYTGWQATIDNKTAQVTGYSPTPVKLFRSVAVPVGSHTVEFRYKPLGF